MSDGLVERLAAIAAELAGEGAVASRAKLISRRADDPVVSVGDVVVKAHAGDAESTALEARVAAAAAPETRSILAAPLPMPGYVRVELGRLVTAWPRGVPVDPENPDSAPWIDAARLLARLHRIDLAALELGLPPCGAPDRVVRAVDRARALPPSAEREAVERAFETLPPWARSSDTPPPHDRPLTLVHGDFHLGQLVLLEGAWCFIDVDDLGRGDPAWDLARPAAWFIAGIIAPETWWGFVHAYVEAGGIAVDDARDPWRCLEPHARALTVQCGALALSAAAGAQRALDELETTWIELCARIGSM
ncbi:MAG: aminoglycoside phosphotransferase family protein [Polyangiaceae bacterium]|nr:aminoglycoside phosphotransferase family protein [Polyangiaceae bacterium]